MTSERDPMWDFDLKLKLKYLWTRIINFHNEYGFPEDYEKENKIRDIECYETILYHLEHLENLEKENQELKLEKKILNGMYRDVRDTADFYMSKCEKFEKAIEILKDKMGLCLFNTKPYEIWLEKKSEELTQQEYELLNEVLKDEKN